MEAKDTIIGILILAMIGLGLFCWHENSNKTKAVTSLATTSAELQTKTDALNKAVAQNKASVIALKKEKAAADNEYNIFVKESNEREDVITGLNEKVEELVAQLMVDPAAPVVKELTNDEKLKALQLRKKAEKDAGHETLADRVQKARAIQHRRKIETIQAKPRVYRRY